MAELEASMLTCACRARGCGLLSMLLRAHSRSAPAPDILENALYAFLVLASTLAHSSPHARRAIARMEHEMRRQLEEAQEVRCPRLRPVSPLL